MLKKHCLFCDQIVPITAEGDYDRYADCSCSPGGFYNLLRDSYETILSFSQQQKREMLYLVSAYIREKTDCGERVTLSAGDLDSIVNSPAIPVTLEDKGNRLLQYLYRHSEGPGEPVVIQPLSSSYNLTYSPNLQELVYLIEKLRSEELLIREGMTFKLTAQGWGEAAAITGGKKIKQCVVLLPNEEELRTEWLEKLLPKIEQYGYLPRVLAQASEEYSLTPIADSKLIIADVTGQSPAVYFAAGYALGLNIPVVWTVKSEDADKLWVHLQEIRPLVWDTAEDLVILLQQKLSL
ncbi:hypothetical protein [Paenibacillus borealis]|uniref:Uncharacterized protein n=1 Tax=Paenibacillus borealis TaxID=160799 RepID=A0A089LNS8_PAEBO|nr:hypothetical protein [Paenibacillus borealis]AIQ60828.1 hypothetical protein PBOR_30790 [Paenibacillus borealis]